MISLRNQILGEQHILEIFTQAALTMGSVLIDQLTMQLLNALEKPFVDKFPCANTALLNVATMLPAETVATGDSNLGIAHSSTFAPVMVLLSSRPVRVRDGIIRLVCVSQDFHPEFV
ncbi:hypothetical protein EVAR_69102_1 [Eumeta japonica]|uniref:Uncharacterized protein n=1 Tax=Eumeta variegata TaxID=151549 RepID=A0A4C1SK42_EUMVA|nr:hypothetical protein EVAR_69102_1 [Eumeta japonica]